MAGYDNIRNKGFDHRSTGEARENGKKGGQASGEKRRRNAKLKTIAKSMKVTDTPERLKEALGKSGIEPDSMGEAVVLSLYLQALKGNVRAIALLMELLGEGAANEIRQQELKLRREELERRKGSGETEKADDGFIEALGETAQSDWEGEDDV